MFTVIPKGPIVSGERVLLQGTSFGKRDEPVIFEITTPEIGTPLTISFVVTTEPGLPAASVRVGSIVDNSINVSFLNVNANGSAGINEPQGLVAVNSIELSMLFQLESKSKSDWFIMHYCFLETSPGEVA